MCNSCCTSLPPKTILSVFLPYSFVLPYKRKTKGRRRGKESDNERCSIEPTQALGTWGTFVGIFAKGGEWWRRMRFGSRRSFVILQPKQNYPKLVIRVYGRLTMFWSCLAIRQTRKREKGYKSLSNYRFGFKVFVIINRGCRHVVVQ